MNAVLDRLPILILSPHSRCNCRCIMCDIWKSTDSREMSVADIERHVESVQGLGVEWVVLTGGEPLMHRDLFRICDGLRARGIRITLLSTGLLLERYAAEIAAGIDEVIVSLDGPPAVHDKVRRVPAAFEKLRCGVEAIHNICPDYPVKARCTVQKWNCGILFETAEAARAMGLGGISYLAADLSSEAFNRESGWPLERQSEIALSRENLQALAAQMDRLASFNPPGFIAESPAKLLRILQHFETHLSGETSDAPVCNAPWVSAVVETDGTVRPCFFHRPIGRVSANAPLLNVLNGIEAIAFRQSLDVASNPICRRCVCSLNWKRPRPEAYEPEIAMVAAEAGLVNPLS